MPETSDEAACLALLRAVNATEADTLRVGVVQNFDGVAIEDRHDGAGEAGGTVLVPQEQGYANED